MLFSMNSVDVQLCSLAMVYSTSRFIHTHTDALHDTKHLASIINSRYCIIVLQLKVHHMPVYTPPPPLSLSVGRLTVCADDPVHESTKSEAVHVPPASSPGVRRLLG